MRGRAAARVLPVAQVKIAPITEEEVVAGLPEIMQKWRETFDREQGREA